MTTTECIEEGAPAGSTESRASSNAHSSAQGRRSGDDRRVASERRRPDGIRARGRGRRTHYDRRKGERRVASAVQPRFIPAWFNRMVLKKLLAVKADAS